MGRVTAVLGPTNTGKTHYAIERMLQHRSGIIGLPLRLLAREVYDRIVARRGAASVALVTGEERIVPERTRYWVATTEAMPLEIGADFVAVDEIQLCADPDRGHVFTDRLLHARGHVETMFMGSETMRRAIAALVPEVEIIRRERFSSLSWAGAKRLARMPPRSAIVAFSVEQVYAIAELIRRTKGGCAVVMGALSPRTRNAQVALYQSGDVDYLVATDAIGMGLNLDIGHVAFAGLQKFDGRRMRALAADELAQIAGRAGRHTAAGTFGTTGDAPPLAPEVIAAIENHDFLPVRKLVWRNNRLDFSSLGRLIASLEAAPTHSFLVRAREADDLRALKALAEMPDVVAKIRTEADVRRLWDICCVPDFRGIAPAEHANLLARLHAFLHDGGKIPSDWLAQNLARIDRPDGTIETLSRRLAFVRTWTYVAQRPGWVEDEAHWRAETRAVEDRLSDALHHALTAQFVDRRTALLMRRLQEREALVAEVNDQAEVTLAGEMLGRLQGFRFMPDPSAPPDKARKLRQAAMAAVGPAFIRRAERFYNAPDTELDLTEQGGLMWGTEAVGKLTAGPEALKPQVVAFVDEDAPPEVAERVRRRLQLFVERKIATLLEPLIALQCDESLTGLARGFAYRLVEAMGVLPREDVAQEVKALDQDARAALRRHGVRFGQYTIFLPALLKPAPTRLRLVLWSLAKGLDIFPESSPPGLVTIPYLSEVPVAHYLLAGYRPAGSRAIRIDMLERLADLLRLKDAKAGFEATPEMLSITGLSLEQFAELMQALGYEATRGERPKTASRPPLEARAEEIAAEAEARAQAEAARLAALAATAASEAATEDDAFGKTVESSASDPEVGPPHDVARARLTVGEGTAHAAPPDGEESADAARTAVLTAEPVAQTVSEGAETRSAEGAEAPSRARPVLMEVFFTFRWAPRPRFERRSPARGGALRNKEHPAHADRPARREGQKASARVTGDRPKGAGLQVRQKERAQRHPSGAPAAQALAEQAPTDTRAGAPEAPLEKAPVIAQSPAEKPRAEPRTRESPRSEPAHARPGKEAGTFKDRARAKLDRPGQAGEGRARLAAKAAEQQSPRIDPDSPFAVLAALREKLKS